MPKINEVDEAKYLMALAIVRKIARGHLHVYRVSDGQILSHLGQAIAGLVAGDAVIGRAALREVQFKAEWEQTLAEVKTAAENGAGGAFSRVLIGPAEPGVTR